MLKVRCSTRPAAECALVFIVLGVSYGLPFPVRGLLVYDMRAIQKEKTSTFKKRKELKIKPQPTF